MTDKTQFVARLEKVIAELAALSNEAWEAKYEDNYKSANQWVAVHSGLSEPSGKLYNVLYLLQFWNPPGS